MITQKIKNKFKKIKNKIIHFVYSFQRSIKDIFKEKLSNEEKLEYRKKIKIYDAFLFFNELDLLEIRLNILNEYVDYFVIVEAVETFSGLPKKLFYEENKARFEKFKHKIIHYVVTERIIDIDYLKNKITDKNINQEEKDIITNTLNFQKRTIVLQLWFCLA